MEDHTLSISKEIRLLLVRLEVAYRSSCSCDTGPYCPHHQDPAPHLLVASLLDLWTEPEVQKELSGIEKLSWYAEDGVIFVELHVVDGFADADFCNLLKRSVLPPLFQIKDAPDVAALESSTTLLNTQQQSSKSRFSEIAQTDWKTGQLTTTTEFGQKMVLEFMKSMKYLRLGMVVERKHDTILEFVPSPQSTHPRQWPLSTHQMYWGLSLDNIRQAWNSGNVILQPVRLKYFDCPLLVNRKAHIPRVTGFHLRFTPQHMAIFLLNYFDIHLDPLLPETALDVAVCCLDIYNLLLQSQAQPTLMVANVVKKLLKRHQLLNSDALMKSYDRDPEFKRVILEMANERLGESNRLKEKFEQLKQLPTVSCGNKTLLEFLKSKSGCLIEPQDFLHDVVHEYIKFHIPQRKETIDEWDLGIQVAEKPKEVYRLKQKFEEYSAHHLQNNYLVYADFKDLFRGRLAFSKFEALSEDQRKNLEKHLVEVKLNEEIGTMYLILDVNGDRFELQVMSSQAASNHEFYELERCPTVDNVRTFVRRHLSEANLCYEQ